MIQIKARLEGNGRSLAKGTTRSEVILELPGSLNIRR